MKKLNNKGFAVSTMLYGTLTIVILVLILLLTIMRSVYNKENAATDNIKYYLNKCIAKQVALEECYESYDDNPANPGNCDEAYISYTTCLGTTNSENTGENLVPLNKLAVNLADTNDTGLYLDSTVTNGSRYTYVGLDPKNYVRIGEMTGRIVSIETDGSIKILLLDGLSEQFDKVIKTTEDTGINAWTSSTLYNSLGIKYHSLDYTNRFVEKSFYVGTIYETNSTSEALERVKDEYFENIYGLVSLDDYLKASSNIKTGSANYCNLTDDSDGSIITALSKCGSSNWMNTGTCAWTNTGVINGGIIDKYITYSTTGYALNSSTTNCSAYMVVYLKSTTATYLNGTGSSSNPFVIY